MTQRDFKRNNNVDNRLASKAAQFYVRQLPSSNLWTGDGIDHINISRFGVTELGSALHHSSPLGFHHKDFGSFDHLAGFYYFIALGAKYPHFRTKEFNRAASMFHAKAMNDEVIDVQKWQVHYLFMDALWRQIRSYPKLVESLKSSTLPFDCYTKRNLGQRRTGINFLMIEGLERIRAFLKDPGDSRYPEFGPYMLDHSHGVILEKYKREFLTVKEGTVENNGEMRRNGLLEAAIEIRGRRKKPKAAEPMTVLASILQFFLHRPKPEYLAVFGDSLSSIPAFLEKFFQQLPWPSEVHDLDEESKILALTIFKGWIMNVATETVTKESFLETATQILADVKELEDAKKDPSQMAGLYRSLEEDLQAFNAIYQGSKEPMVEKEEEEVAIHEVVLETVDGIVPVADSDPVEEEAEAVVDVTDESESVTDDSLV